MVKPPFITCFHSGAAMSNAGRVRKMDFSRIKELRIDHDATQQALADYLNLTRSAYSNYENGIRDIPIEILAGIADYYHTSVDYLIKRTDERRPYPERKGSALN